MHLALKKLILIVKRSRQGVREMNKRWLIIALFVLGFFIVYEIFNNGFSVFLIITGVIALIIGNSGSGKKQNTFTLIGLGTILLAIFSSRVILIMLVIALVLLVGQFPELFQVAREAIKKTHDSRNSSEFIMVNFNQTNQKRAKMSKNKWFGNDDESTSDIYSWSDVNFSKLAGNTIFDLGNTILPKEQNVILINKGFGKTKILVPEGVAFSLDVSILLGELNIGSDTFVLKNENLKWESEQYETNARKVKIVISQLVGEVEVVNL